MKLIRIITKHLPVASVAILMAACATEDYVGDQRLHEANENGRPVSFDLVAAPQTRSQRIGEDAASDLNRNFVVWGDKTVTEEGVEKTQTVFNNYLVNYASNSANTTTTNSAGWEYIGCVFIPYGTTTSSDQPLNDQGAVWNSANQVNGIYQSIKYWDYSADNYHFFAYSLGKGHSVTTGTGTETVTTISYAKATAMNSTGYKLSGSVEELAACYISDKVTRPNAEMTASNTQVSLQFRKLGAKVKIALYETIPGYSVKNVRFYQSASATTPGTTAYLYAADGETGFNREDGGQFDITFTGDTPNLGWTSSGTDKPYISFGDAVTTSGTTWTGWQGKEYMEAAENVYLGRSSTQATGPADYVTVLPYPEGTTLALKVDYTLLSRDNSEETIEVKGATAVIPAQYAAWKPNCSYTYLFKISDNTPGETAPGIAGLYPITLDAIVNVTADGTQETITTVTEPSITTYQKGSNYATINEYTAGKPIYIVVYDGTGVATLTDKARLFTVTNVAGTGDGVGEKPAKEITEANVADVLAKTPDESGNYVTTDANKWIMTVSPSTETLDLTNKVPAGDTPDGAARDFGEKKVAWFTPEAPTAPATTKYYVFQYLAKAAVDEKPAEYQYKVIKVKAATP